MGPFRKRSWCAAAAVAAGLLASFIFPDTPAAGSTARIFLDDGQTFPLDRALTAKTRTLFPGKKTLLQGWAEINSSNCTLVDTGKTVTVTEQKYGKLQIGVLTANAVSGPCAGTEFIFSVVYYTWTTSNLKKTTDKFSVRWFTKDGQFQEDTDYTILRAPRILQSGKDVTGTTRKAAIGERIALTTTPVETGQTQSWNVSSDYVGFYGRGNKGKVVDADFSRSETTFYWTTTGDKEVNYSLTLPNGDHGEALVTFDVEGPTVNAVNTGLGDVQIISVGGMPWLSFGDVVEGATPGIRFEQFSSPPPQSGQFLWAQLIDSYKLTKISATDVQHCAQLPGLDNVFPYSTGDSTNDSPAASLPASLLRLRKDQAFRMFLMWQSDKQGSIPVPLGYVVWLWSGTAAQNTVNHSWKVTSSAKSASPFSPGNEFPIWDRIITNSSELPCH